MEIRAGIPRLSYRKFYGIRGCVGGGSKGTLKLCENVEFMCWGRVNCFHQILRKACGLQEVKKAGQPDLYRGPSASGL